MTVQALPLWDRLRSHSLVRQVSGMMALTAIGQGLYLLAGPFIGRLYTPEEVGYFGLFFTAWTFLGLFACGLYDLAIPAAADDDEARRLSGLSIVLGVGAALLSGGLIALAATQGWYGFGVLPVWAGAVMATGMLTHMLVLIGQAWAIRRDEVMAIGQANVLMNGARSLLQVIGGLLSPVWAIMIAGEISARLAQAQWLRRGAAPHGGKQYGWAGLRTAMRDHRRFPIIFGPAFVLDSIAMLIQTSMIGTLFGAAAMGQFFLMRRTLDLPVAFAFRSLSDLFLARQLVIARENPNRLRPFFLRAAAVLAFSGAVASVPLFIWGPELFRLFYGSNWGMAGKMAAIMAPAMVLNLAVAPVSRVFQISEKAQLRLLPGIVNLVGALLMLWLAGHFQLTLILTVIGISVAISAHYVVYFLAGYVAANFVNLEKLSP